jgi:hypothetical protein
MEPLLFVAFEFHLVFVNQCGLNTHCKGVASVYTSSEIPLPLNVIFVKLGCSDHSAEFTMKQPNLKHQLST